MIIEVGEYKTVSGDIVVVYQREVFPVPTWHGYFKNNSVQKGAWTDEGKEISGYKRWDLIKKIEKKDAIIKEG